MDTSVAWINDYLDSPVDADMQADLLTHAGFPLEGRTDVEGDVRQDFEMTSNRGDCTCHVGLAREIAALSDRELQIPAATPPTDGADVTTLASLTNEDPTHCPWYTGRVITGITVGQAPQHVRSRLLARGDIPRSNVVDATNFVLFEAGQPTHVFDLDTLSGRHIIVRMARKGERFLPIGEGAVEIELDGTELVIADEEGPVALAGVKGGARTAVTEATTNILVEAATFDPVMVRHSSRLHNISSDSSFRFERGVSPGQVDAAAERLCSLILETAGGELAPGVLRSGAAMPDRVTVTMRTDRCRDLLGLDIPDQQQVDMLTGLDFEPVLEQGVITATVPFHRGDIHREVDLIEEVMRMHGFADVPVDDAVTIRPAADPPEHEARASLTAALVDDGFVETVTHSLIADRHMDLWLRDGCRTRRVHEARAAGFPTLRPSIIPSLTSVRARNADQGVSDLRLFELGSVFEASADGAHAEDLELGLLMDQTNEDDGIRPIRGALDHVLAALGADDIRVEPCEPLPWLNPAGRVLVDGAPIGFLGRLSPAAAEDAGLEAPLPLAATIRPKALMQAPRPDREASPLPEFPGIERDISLIVPESITWAAVSGAIASSELPHLDRTDFVTTWRGKGVPEGHKSVTARLLMRAPDRTLTREEVEAPIASLLNRLRSELGAEIRT
ncbi:MAG: phenylalanine--tRNA ligase subunit beta [Phycisphaerales bacterium]|jgi:phenylalanyl-tRNA synthetase beta chain|nr:phenylalanine--tRNA ligase subunit beta [Phycisphaerales bacterium]